MAAVSGYTTNYNFPLFEDGAGGWGSGDNGFLEWLDEELKKRENLLLDSNGSFVKDGDDMLYHLLD